MINRGREIAKMMGYATTEALLEAIGKGELILLKLPEGGHLQAANWLREKTPEVRAVDANLGDTLEELSSGLEFSLELGHYPADADVCEMDLPHGWPSYCEKDHIR